MSEYELDDDDDDGPCPGCGSIYYTDEGCESCGAEGAGDDDDDGFFDDDDDPDNRVWDLADEAAWEELEARREALELEIADLSGMSLEELLEAVHELSDEEADEYAEVTFGAM